MKNEKLHVQNMVRKPRKKRIRKLQFDYSNFIRKHKRLRLVKTEKQFLKKRLKRWGKFDTFEKILFFQFHKKYKYFVYFNQINHKTYLIQPRMKTQYYLSTLYDLFRPYSNFLLFQKFVNLIMYDGKKGVAESLMLKVLEILKTDYKILNPFYKLKYLIYKHLVPYIKPEKIVRKIKTKVRKKNNKIGYETIEEIKYVPRFLRLHFRVNYTIKLLIKGARMMTSSFAYSLVAEILNMFKLEGFLFKYNHETIKLIHEHRLYNIESNPRLDTFEAQVIKKLKCK